MQDRIVITGMGTVNPLGLSVNETWHNLIAGVSGVGPITLFDSRAAALQVHIAAEVKGFKPENFMDAKEARRRDRFEQFAIAAAKQALLQAGLEITEKNTIRFTHINSRNRTRIKDINIKGNVNIRILGKVFYLFCDFA